MPVPTPPASWAGSLLWLIGLSVAAFGVSWLLATRLRLGRVAYIGVLFAMTAAMSAGYIAWLGLGAGEIVTTRWGWGLLAAPIAGALPAFGMTRLPPTNRRTGRALGAALVWEGLVYGVAEGVLLSALPAFMTWQLVHSLGWNGFVGGLARWTLPVLASIVVIVVHHLGYAEYRNRQLLPISAGCGLLTVGYLITASVIAPMLGHVLMHAVAILHGTELPPLTGPSTANMPGMGTTSPSRTASPRQATAGLFRTGGDRSGK